MKLTTTRDTLPMQKSPFLMQFYFHIIIMIIFNFYIALNTNVSKRLKKYTITPVIGFSACPHTLCAQSQPPGEHSSRALLDAHKLFDQQWRPDPTGYPFDTWVESSKCKLISCQRILVPCRDSNSRPSHLQSSALNHSTTTLPLSGPIVYLQVGILLLLFWYYWRFILFENIFLFRYVLKIKISSGHSVVLWKKRCGIDQKRLII